MSDPVTNVEIEDVLSSIRRLVSADDRPEPRTQARDATGATDKLVLTPAQRVNETTDPSFDELDTAQPQGQEDRFDDALREVEDAEILSTSSARMTTYTATDTDQDYQDVAKELSAELPEFLMRRNSKFEDTAEDAETIAEDVAALVEDPAEHETAHAFEDAAELDEAALQEKPETAFLEEPADPFDDRDLETRIAEVEDAVAQQDDEWEPDGTDSDPFGTEEITPLPWTDETNDDVEEVTIDVEAFVEDHETVDQDAPADEAQSAESEAPQEDGAQAWFDEDAMLDEEALRDLISEIVRQELQGALGERITRNVRKLVRREIHRALLSQGLD